MSKLQARITAAVNALRDRDATLYDELQSKRRSPALAEEGRRSRLFTESTLEMPEEDQAQLTIETIVLRTGRPVLTVARNEAQLQFRDAESEVWRDRLTTARSQLGHAIRAVGRVEVTGHRQLDWLGTGWLVRPDIIVTNRHVAAEFGRASGRQFVFRAGTGGRPMTASVDFLEEFGNTQDLTFQIQRILHIESDNGPDMAFLQVRGTGPAEPLKLARNAPAAREQVAVIGYPARDSRIPDQQLMFNIFGDVFDKKRLAPGQITRVAPNQIQHDCSTLGGNSGSVVLGLDSGEAFALHFAGRFLEANFAVPSTVITERLARIGSGAVRPRPEVLPAQTVQQAPEDQLQTVMTPSGNSQVSFTVPLRITVELGAQTAPQAPAAPAVVTASPISAGLDDADDDGIFETEARPEDYRDRPGYDTSFLGGGIEIPLPVIERDAGQIVTFQFDGSTEDELRYQHFSVKMHRARRVCFFSAVNINGGESKRTRRPGWRLDPRIPANLQILQECYGNPPKFSRGHMTRREDPAWGSTSDAELGNADSMHVTNAVPQMQTFNGGIWLGLEDYALQNARQDDMRICVFTGPILLPSDPVKFRVKIPVDFWKVIAFVHDETGELSASGYSISQRRFLRVEEFVFGAYETHQRSLAWIEQRAGLSFGELTEVDAFTDSEEAQPSPLTSLRQIRFV